MVLFLSLKLVVTIFWPLRSNVGNGRALGSVAAAPAIESKVKNWRAGAENEAMTDVRCTEDLPPPGRRLLYHMDVKGGVDNLGELEEVGVGGVGSSASEDSLQKVGELGKSPRLVGKNEITITLNVHLVVEHNLPWLVVFVDDLGLDALDVLAVVVDVLLWRLPVLQDVVVVSVVDDQNTSRLQHVIHVLNASLVIPKISVVVYEMREGVAHADDGIVASPGGLHVLVEGHPVAFLDGPVEEGLLPPPLPTKLEGILQHLVREVTGCEREGGDLTHLLDQHHRVDTGAAGSIQDRVTLLLLQQVDQEVLVVGRPVLLLSDVEEPVLGGDAVCVLVGHSGLSHARGEGLNGTHHCLLFR